MIGYRGLMILLGTVPLLVGLGSYFAGEQIEVVALRTVDHEGRDHDTKLWIVDHDGRPWVRSIRPTLRWLERIRANPRVELVRGGVTTAYTATIVETASAKQAIDAAMVAKYGWIDRWYDVIVRHQTLPIRLDPVAEPPGS
jgi:hypothetical protein